MTIKDEIYWWLLEAQNKYSWPRWLNKLVYWLREQLT